MANNRTWAGAKGTLKISLFVKKEAGVIDLKRGVVWSWGQKVRGDLHGKNSEITINTKPTACAVGLLSGGQDSNLRPHGPKPCILPG